MSGKKTDAETIPEPAVREQSSIMMYALRASDPATGATTCPNTVIAAAVPETAAAVKTKTEREETIIPPAEIKYVSMTGTARNHTKTKTLSAIPV